MTPEERRMSEEQHRVARDGEMPVNPDLKGFLGDRKIESLQPGAETDRLVAEALDLAGWSSDGGPFLGQDLRVFVEGEHRPFRPSRDLNDAHLAAERAGLFDKWLLGKWREGWYFQDHSERQMRGVKESTTPALAICKAILKLKGNDGESDG